MITWSKPVQRLGMSLAGTLLFIGAAIPLRAGQSAPIVQPGAPGADATPLSAEQSVALGESRYIAADALFMQNMIIHHQQAVDMAALIADRTRHQGVHQMGQRIAIAQADEIAMMRTWLKRRNEALVLPEGSHHHAHHGGGEASDTASDVPVMTGMLSPAQMIELAGLEGGAFDRYWLAGMIVHHQGALDMVNDLMANPGAGEDPKLSEFLTAIVADQTSEIARMKIMLDDSRRSADKE